MLDPLTEHQFEQVCTAREHGMKSKEIAEELGVELREANAAFLSATYEGYLERQAR